MATSKKKKRMTMMMMKMQDWWIQMSMLLESLVCILYQTSLDFRLLLLLLVSGLFLFDAQSRWTVGARVPDP